MPNSDQSELQKLSAEENSKDSISKLPDCVLCHILSFVPTKTAVAASILSKRWRLLWTCVPSVDLDVDEVVPEGSYEYLLSIMNKVFLSRVTSCCIKRFRFKTHSFKRWQFSWIAAPIFIDAAVAHKVEELDLFLGYGYMGDCKIPHSVFNCKTLVVLKLAGGDVTVDAPSSVHLPKLKVLHLLNVKYKEDQSIRNLLAGCLILEELHVKRFVTEDNIVEYEITSPSLRSLVVIFSSRGFPNSRDRVVLINKVHLKNLCSLVEAKIDVYPYFALFWEDYEHSVDVLQALNNVKFLELSQSTMKALCCYTYDDFPTFVNLFTLKLDGFCCSWNLLLNLLVNSPFLKHLTICTDAKIHGHCVCHYETECWMQPPDVPACLSYHLTTFWFGNGFVDWENDTQFVRYILEKSLVLENMTIGFGPEHDLNQKFAVQQELEMFVKSSGKCQVKFN